MRRVRAPMERDMDGTIQRKKTAPDTKSWKPQTRAVRGGLRRSDRRRRS